MFKPFLLFFKALYFGMYQYETVSKKRMENSKNGLLNGLLFGPLFAKINRAYLEII